MPVLPSCRNQSIDLGAYLLTGFYMRATLAFTGLNEFTHKILASENHSLSYLRFL